MRRSNRLKTLSNGLAPCGNFSAVTKPANDRLAVLSEVEQRLWEIPVPTRRKQPAPLPIYSYRYLSSAQLPLATAAAAPDPAEPPRSVPPPAWRERDSPSARRSRPAPPATAGARPAPQRGSSQDLGSFYSSSGKGKQNTTKEFSTRVLPDGPPRGAPALCTERCSTARRQRKDIVILQLESGWRLWHPAVNIGVVKNHELPRDDLNDLLSSSSYKKKKKVM